MTMRTIGDSRRTATELSNMINGNPDLKTKTNDGMLQNAVQECQKVESTHCQIMTQLLIADYNNVSDHKIKKALRNSAPAYQQLLNCERELKAVLKSNLQAATKAD